LLPVQPVTSIACTVNVELPSVVGVPDNVPPESRLRPAGNVPALLVKVYPPLPPLAVMVWLYADPTVPVGNVLGDTVIVEHAGCITRV
jgi:hypothetical protein